MWQVEQGTPSLRANNGIAKTALPSAKAATPTTRINNVKINRTLSLFIFCIVKDPSSSGRLSAGRQIVRRDMSAVAAKVEVKQVATRPGGDQASGHIQVTEVEVSCSKNSGTGFYGESLEVQLLFHLI